jgi:hypothetical protein
VSIAPAKLGKGFAFTGPGYISVPHASALTLTNQTIELWYQLSTEIPNGYSWIDKGRQSVGHGDGPVNYGINGWLNAVKVYYNDPTVAGGGDDQNQWETSVYLDAPSPGEFHHLAATYRQLEDNRVRLETYSDGDLVKTLEVPGSLASAVNTDPLIIGPTGGRLELGEAFLGIMDEVALYNRALTAAEIIAIYEAGSAGILKPFR